MSDIFLLYAVLIFIGLAFDMASKIRKMPHTRVARPTKVGYPPVTPAININPKCPDCNSWLRNHPDAFVCPKCGYKTKDIRRTTKNIPGTKIKERP